MPNYVNITETKYWVFLGTKFVIAHCTALPSLLSVLIEVERLNFVLNYLWDPLICLSTLNPEEKEK